MGLDDFLKGGRVTPREIGEYLRSIGASDSYFKAVTKIIEEENVGSDEGLDADSNCGVRLLLLASYCYKRDREKAYI